MSHLKLHPLFIFFGVSTIKRSDIKKQYISVQEAATILDCHEKTIRRWIAAKKIPAVKIGKEYKINCEKLERILENG